MGHLWPRKGCAGGFRSKGHSAKAFFISGEPPDRILQKPRPGAAWILPATSSVVCPEMSHGMQVCLGTPYFPGRPEWAQLRNPFPTNTD